MSIQDTRAAYGRYSVMLCSLDLIYRRMCLNRFVWWKLLTFRTRSTHESPAVRCSLAAMHGMHTVQQDPPRGRNWHSRRRLDLNVQ